jgi:DNA-3-methyladenine glycosylase II
VRSIVSQQISVAAARTIWRRLEEAVEPHGIRPEVLARFTVARFRKSGVSRQKAGYLHDLSEKCRDGTVRLSRLGRMTDDQVVEELIQVKGIGRWSAHMFLIFALGRPDVFPHDDLGLRSAIVRLYKLEKLPDREACLAIGDRWRPYSSLGSWYCWRFLELPKTKGR